MDYRYSRDSMTPNSSDHKSNKMASLKNFVKNQKSKRMFSRSAFTTTLDKATSHLQLEPDWDSIITLTDLIRQGDVGPKLALCAIKKKIYAQNVHVNSFALLVLEACMKNCGPSFHVEVANRAFMEELHELIKQTNNDKIKEKLLELIQAWSYAFRNDPNFRAVQDMQNLLKIEGFKFPPLKESDAMFVASIAPQWSDGDCCNRCRVSFSLLERKHHCRHCGQVFCQKCSSRQCIIPKYGFERETRVCDDCFEKLTQSAAGAIKNSTAPSLGITSGTVTGLTGSSSSPSSSNLANVPSAKNGTTATSTPTSAGTKSKEEIEEEEQLQLALALSQSEAEFKQKSEQPRSYSLDQPFSYPSSSTSPMKSALANSAKSHSTESNHHRASFDDSINLDPALSKYLDRQYWERRQMKSGEPSAPTQQPNSTLPRATANVMIKTEEPTMKPAFETVVTNGETYASEEEEEIEQFRTTLKSAIEMFVNRMNSNRNRNRPITSDTGVQSMFLNISNLHPQLVRYIKELNDQRGHFELLQDKLAQVKDARAALDSLREEHNEKMRRKAEQEEHERQQQIAMKLEIMRKKKQESVHYQQQMALQLLQNQGQNYGGWATAQPLPSAASSVPGQPQMYNGNVYPHSPTPVSSAYGGYADSMQQTYMHQGPPPPSPQQQQQQHQQNLYAHQGPSPQSVSDQSINTSVPQSSANQQIHSSQPTCSLPPTIASQHFPTNVTPAVGTPIPVPQQQQQMTAQTAPHPSLTQLPAAAAAAAAHLTPHQLHQAAILGQMSTIPANAYLAHLSHNASIPLHLGQPMFAGSPYNMQAIAASLPQVGTSLPAAAVQLQIQQQQQQQQLQHSLPQAQPEQPKPQVEEAPLISFD